MDSVASSARALVAEIAAVLDGGDNEAAAELAAHGLSAWPDAVVFHRLRGIALFSLGSTDEATQHLTSALTIDPLDNAALIALAGIADMLGDPYTAAENLLTAWEHDPANRMLRADLTERLAALYGPEGYLQLTRPALAALYARNTFPIRAEREYRVVIAEHPDRLDLRLAATLARWRLGKLAETVESGNALLAMHPQLVRARWALADAIARQGNGEAAREHAKQSARYDPDGGIARELIATIPDAAIVDPDEPLTIAAQIAGIAAIGVLPALHDPQDVPYVEPEEQAALDATAMSADGPPEPVVAMAAADGQIVATTPGGEPALDATDALPVPSSARGAAGLSVQDGGERAGAQRRVPSPPVPVTTVEDAIGAVRERLTAGDFAGAVAGMRAALQATGKDTERVRSLLPALRALVDAAQRPDAHRLLGDAYRQLGQYAQAEGQYRQALLVRVAGKGAAT
jgi:tetratricopeptide (TPR) repeat protein